MARQLNAIQMFLVFLLGSAAFAGWVMRNGGLRLNEALGYGIVASLGVCLWGYSMRPAEKEQPLGRVVLKRAGQITGALLFVMAGLYALSR